MPYRRRPKEDPRSPKRREFDFRTGAKEPPVPRPQVQKKRPSSPGH